MGTIPRIPPEFLKQIRKELRLFPGGRWVLHKLRLVRYTFSTKKEEDDTVCMPESFDLKGRKKAYKRYIYLQKEKEARSRGRGGRGGRFAGKPRRPGVRRPVKYR